MRNDFEVDLNIVQQRRSVPYSINDKIVTTSSKLREHAPVPEDGHA
jgi:hypothetical protein